MRPKATASCASRAASLRLFIQDSSRRAAPGWAAADGTSSSSARRRSRCLWARSKYACSSASCADLGPTSALPRRLRTLRVAHVTCGASGDQGALRCPLWKEILDADTPGLEGCERRDLRSAGAENPLRPGRPGRQAATRPTHGDAPQVGGRWARWGLCTRRQGRPRTPPDLVVTELAAVDTELG